LWNAVLSDKSIASAQSTYTSYNPLRPSFRLERLLAVLSEQFGLKNAHWI